MMSGFKSPNHTQVPNDFFDMIPDMSDAELRVTLIMIRDTRGWHRDATKLGKGELSKRSGLSYNGTTAGCESAEKRGTFRRTNPEAKTRAEWELVTEEEPSASEGVENKDPQPVRKSPSASEGQVRVKESIKKIKKNTFSNESNQRTKRIQDLMEIIPESIGLIPQNTEEWKRVLGKIYDLEQEKGWMWSDFAAWFKAGNDYNRPKIFQISKKPKMLVEIYGQAFLDKNKQNKITLPKDGSGFYA